MDGTKLVLADVDVASASGSTSGIGGWLLVVAASAGMYASRIRQAAQPPARCVSHMSADGTSVTLVANSLNSYLWYPPALSRGLAGSTLPESAV